LPRPPPGRRIGRIKSRLFLDSYRERHDNDELIRLAAEVL
jgi:hypothetical protein